MAETDRAETYLRLLAEREIRERAETARLRHAAAVLTEAGALSEETAARIAESAEFALAVRMPRDARPSVGFSIGPGPAEPRKADGPWQVVPVGRTIAGRTGPILVSAVVRTDEEVFLAAMQPSGDPVPLDDIVALSATDDTGATYALTRNSPTAIEFDPPPPPRARSVTILDQGTERVRLDLPVPRSPAGPELPTHPAEGSAAERLLLRHAEALLASAARARIAWLVGGTPARRMEEIAPGQRPPLGQSVEILRGAGLLSPDSPVPAQLAALCQQLRLPADGLPSPADLPQAWDSVLTQYGRLRPQHTYGDAFLTPLAVPLPDLDGLRVLLTGVSGSHLHMIFRTTVVSRSSWRRATWSHGPRPHMSARSGPALSVWGRDDAGNWHLATRDDLRGEPRFVSTTLTFCPPLGRDVTELTLTVTGRATSTTLTIPARG